MAAQRKAPAKRSTRPGLCLALSPQGTLRLEPDPDAEPLPTRLERELLAAFETGHATGLLHLGAAKITADLPPSLTFWRRFAHDLVARWCHAPSDTTTQTLVPPPEDLDAYAWTAPAMLGAEYLDATVLADLWQQTEAALQTAAAQTEGGLAGFLATLDPAWHQVGRVCFHLAENKQSLERPFAFLATYAPRIGKGGRVQHQPLSAALREFAGDRPQLVRLLEPVRRAAESSDLVAALLADNALFQPWPWTADTAHRFLLHAAAIEAAGVVVRLPDWWHPDPRRRPRVTAQVELGSRDSQVGFDALLDFRLEAALDGEPLSEDEWHQLAAEAGGLRLVRGRWVEIDPDKVRQALNHWERLRQHAADGISFAAGMRMLAGVRLDAGDDTEDEDGDWTTVVPDRQLQGLLEAIRDPTRATDADPGRHLHAELRPYQQTGLRWLWSLHQIGLGACLADDMGLGKTIQIIALLLRARQVRPKAGPALVIVPASLLANWAAELERFAPSLRVLIAHSSALGPGEVAKLTKRRLASQDVVLTTYGTLLRHEWPTQRDWRLLVLDEAQAIKNPATRQTRAVKALRAPSRIALTGTPVENRLSDLWSIFDFLNPGLLGSLAQFRRYQQRLQKEGHGPLRQLIRPYILRRLKSDKRVIADLPDKSEVRAWCALRPRQAKLYEQAVDDLRQILDEQTEGVARRGAVLATLLRLKQICNHPSQWLDDGVFKPTDSGKFAACRNSPRSWPPARRRSWCSPSSARWWHPSPTSSPPASAAPA